MCMVVVVGRGHKLAPPPPPALETFVNFRNFAGLHLRLFKNQYKSAAGLAQLDKRRSSEREAAGSSPGRTKTQGL